MKVHKPGCAVFGHGLWGHNTKRVHDMNALFHIHLCIPMCVFHFCINFTCKGNRDELKEGQQLGVAMDSTGDRFIVSLTVRVL